MQVSVETLNGLERKVTVCVPSEKIEEEVTSRLRTFAPKAKIQGFRAGKVPANLLRQRFADGIRQEAAREMIQSTLFEALKSHDLIPVGMPDVMPEHALADKDFTYFATFEIYPEINVVELSDEDEIEVVHANVSDDDLTAMLNTLREQNKNWNEVSRPVQNGDKVTIDFKGFLGDEAFEGGSAEQYELVIGSGSMIPGFEDGLIGAEKDTPMDLNITFPEDYGHAPLAGKDARFAVTVTSIKEGVLPELDAAFAEKFNIKDGSIDALKQDIKENMSRELQRRIDSMNRKTIFDKLLEKHAFDLPASLVNQEIENLKHEMYHQVFGHHHSDDEKIPDFPRVLFEDKARKRVQLGLLFSEYVKKHEIIVEPARVDAMIEKLAGAYEDPEELRSWYHDSKERRGDIESLILEEMAAEKILSFAKKVEKILSYDQVVHPEKSQENKGE